MQDLKEFNKRIKGDNRERNRRVKSERRTETRIDKVPESGERRQNDRRSQDRRRHIDPTTCERDYSMDEVEFMRAIDDYKRRSGRQFPTWSEVLEVIRDLGYRKVAEKQTTYSAETAATV
jgi:FMN phosphatase YigB (HAD superfamily)